MSLRRLTLPVSLVVWGCLLPGCGGATGRAAHAAPRAGDPAGVAVIRRWADTLRRGDVAGAAALFALPSRFVNGSGSGAIAVRLSTRAEAVAANATLPCGAVLLATHRDGRYINALFRLTARPGVGGTACGGGGTTARTDFLIRGGKIAAWLRAADQPGDDPSRSTAGGPVV